MKPITFLMRIRTFFTIKRTIWTGITILTIFLVWFFFIREPLDQSIQTAKVVRKNIKKTVLTTGQVVSATDLSLSFQSSGVVRTLNVVEGQKVRAGNVLATLDQTSARASLESARGALTQARANYEKIKAGATEADIAVSQSAVDSAEATLENAKQTLINQISKSYNDTYTAVISSTNILFSSPQSNSPQFSISGTVQTNTQAVTAINQERVTINSMLDDWKKKISSLNESSMDSLTNLSLDNLTLTSNYLSNVLSLLNNYTQVTSGGSQTTVTTYVSAVSSAKTTIDASYTTLTSYNQSVKSATYSMAQAEASLKLKKTSARQEDVQIALAQVQSAEGNFNSAQAVLNNTMIIAPASGTITEVKMKLGEQATAMAGVIKLLDVGRLHTEAQVSEADIASVLVGQVIDNTFDALGPDRHFQSKVSTVNPASTLVSGVVNYKVTGSLENIPEIKPGMTSNMTILVSEIQSAIVVTSSSIINKDGKKYVRVILDPKKKTYEEREISVGLFADGGEVEVLGGLTEGEEVVTFVK
jgi:HlyD family secretion protein